MPNIADTAYPRFKSHPSNSELIKIYTPTAEEVQFCELNSRSQFSKIHLMLLLKSFQRLGYFVTISDIPDKIYDHIVDSLYGQKMRVSDHVKIKRLRIQSRHMDLVRNFLGVGAFDNSAKILAEKTALKAASLKEDIPDIINIVLEELVRNAVELPGFSTIVKIAKQARIKSNKAYYGLIAERIGVEGRRKIDLLLKLTDQPFKYSWNKVKQEPKSPTIKNIKDFSSHLSWLKTLLTTEEIFSVVPDIKIRQLSLEARSLNANRMQEISAPKRYSLAAALIFTQRSKGIDDLIDMLIKRIQKLHNTAREDLVEYQLQHMSEAHELVNLLQRAAIAYQNKSQEMLNEIFGKESRKIIEKCDSFNAYAGNNYFPFMIKRYRSCRSAIFSILEHVTLRSTSSDVRIEAAATFLKCQKNTRSKFISIPKGLDLSWIGEKWLKSILQKENKYSRRFLELCILTQIMADLKSGDLCVIGADKYSDYRDQLVSLKEFSSQRKRYCKEVNLSQSTKAIINKLRQNLGEKVAEVDRSFPSNYSLRYDGDKIVLAKIKKKRAHHNLSEIDQLIQEKIQKISIIDVLTDTDSWIQWTKNFGPHSGLQPKLGNLRERYIATTFCYGCNLGPTQTARSLRIFNRKHLSFVNQGHISEDKIDKAIVKVINAYNKFSLPQIWGKGDSVSADGTKWELYENNLLSEFHIRYRGYGGIGYYHVSDKYIALFSHFIPCGVWEAVHILDGLLKNESDIRPDTVYGDTQGQSGPVFGLAYLLGINLMPRIRNWQDLTFYRANPSVKYEHIDDLFTGEINWKLIEDHMDDMLRVVISIKSGKVTASSILRRLGNYSRKNRLYFAFRELGRVIRTNFLLEFISNIELRRTINAATNKSEAFNNFVKWVGFGGQGLIAENSRDDQRKFIKYNHLVASLVVLHTVNSMTHAISQLSAEGIKIDQELLNELSPYRTEHINRFGDYFLRLGECTSNMQVELPDFQENSA